MPTYLEFEVALLGITPRIWRRFLLPSTTTFLDLSQAIQDAGPWWEGHLWEFREWGRKGKTITAPPAAFDDFDDDLDEASPEPQKVKLRDVFTRAQKKVLYLYDFGDSWEHEVQLKRVVELPERFKGRLIAGERAFPPEDCGGVWGYYECLLAVGAIKPAQLDDPPSEDALDERREWLGDWSPDFDLEAAKKEFDG
jgi:hypothetical protein